MTTVATNSTKSHEKPAETTASKPTDPQTTAAAPAPTPKPPLAVSEAVRLMLTTLKRVDPSERARVLASLAALA